MTNVSLSRLMYTGLSIDSWRSDFVHLPSLPNSESDIGKARFSWTKKLSKSQSLDWLAMYRLENNRQSGFIDFIFSFLFEDFDANLRFNSGSLKLFKKIWFLYNTGRECLWNRFWWFFLHNSFCHSINQGSIHIKQVGFHYWENLQKVYYCHFFSKLSVFSLLTS